MQPSQFKVVVCGRAGVGKTSLLCATDTAWQFASNRQPATIGVDFFLRTVTADDGTAAVLQFWDTAGQERFAPPSALVYRRADAVIFVYDLTDRASYEAMGAILAAALGAEPRCFVIIVGNKLDLAPTARVVTTAEVAAGCASHNYSFLETSAHDRTGVDAMLAVLANALVQRHRRRPPTTDGAAAALDGRPVPIHTAPPIVAERSAPCAC
jgi:small GTP-binding protein